jgi:nicotinamidase-related amidase
MSYDPSSTAILLVDPYNNFLSEGGKLWSRVKAVAEEAKLLNHLREVVSTARARGLKIFLVPHHRWESGDYVAFDNPSPYQLAGANAQIFAKDSWGGTFHDDFQPQPGDVVVHEHWGSSGFANTDLDFAQATRRPSHHPDRHDRQHLHRIDRPLRHGARVPRHADQGRHRRLQP